MGGECTMDSSLALKAAVMERPAWITPELLVETISVWQPRYARPLTTDDAIEILLNVAALFDALGDADVEAVSSLSESF
jgi:hypothetical protein